MTSELSDAEEAFGAAEKAGKAAFLVLEDGKADGDFAALALASAADQI